MMLKKLLIFFFTLSAINLFAVDTLRVLYHQNYYPYAFENNLGEPDGVLIDYWKLWGTDNNTTIQFIASNERNFVDIIKNNEADILAGTAIIDTFVKAFDYGEYILRINTSLFLTKNKNPKSIHEIDFPILIFESYHVQDLLAQKYPDLEIEICTDMLVFRDKINSHEYGGFIYDFPSPLGGKTNFNIPNGYYSYMSLSTENIRLRPAVKKGNQDLLNIILLGSSKISDEELFAIAEKWRYSAVQNNYLIIGQVVLLFTILVLVYIIIQKRAKSKAKTIAPEATFDDLQILIKNGENDFVEFKSSLRWDYRQEIPNKALEVVIIKTISAFLNTNGGKLFIGVDDDGNILGLDKDYQSLGKKNVDGFKLAFTNLINNSLGKNSHQFIEIEIVTINEKDVCAVHIKKSNNPVFFGKGDKEEFYIRASASSQPMNVRETHEYISSHWKK